jgi:multimeric flavodoxin WrbA
MSKVPVPYYSSYGHIEAMASAVAEGAREAGGPVDIKRVPELVPDDVARSAQFKLDQAARSRRSTILARMTRLSSARALAVMEGASRPRTS